MRKKTEKSGLNMPEVTLTVLRLFASAMRSLALVKLTTVSQQPKSSVSGK